jgi:hypothetical protein
MADDITIIRRGVGYITLFLRSKSAAETLSGYKFPNDEREQDRLDLFHSMFRHMLGNRLFLAPIKEGPLRVLDIGTGTGIWAIEFGALATLYQRNDNQLRTTSG